MSTYDPLPFLRSANDAHAARSAELLAQLSAVPLPEWTPHTPLTDIEIEAEESEEMPWLTEQN